MLYTRIYKHIHTCDFICVWWHNYHFQKAVIRSASPTGWFVLFPQLHSLNELNFNSLLGIDHELDMTRSVCSECRSESAVASQLQFDVQFCAFWKKHSYDKTEEFCIFLSYLVRFDIQISWFLSSVWMTTSRVAAPHRSATTLWRGKRRSRLFWSGEWISVAITYMESTVFCWNFLQCIYGAIYIWVWLRWLGWFSHTEKWFGLPFCQVSRVSKIKYIWMITRISSCSEDEFVINTEWYNSFCGSIAWYWC